MNKFITNYRIEMEQELKNILAYWMTFSIDLNNGGFYGRIDQINTIQENAPKSSVLNSRILWTFSAAYNHTKKPAYLQAAERAFKYLIRYFLDKEFGGIYWTVDYRGNADDTKKQVHAVAFAIYGLSEYYRASEDETAKQTALNLYKVIVERCYDTSNGGYFEAWTRDWKGLEDLRLSYRDCNEMKSMNTHLHILEAFANLYRIWPDKDLKRRITELIQIFKNQIIDKETNHLVLFFDERWNPKANIISYGHDIEASWLIQEAAEILQDHEVVEKVKVLSLQLVEAAQKGLDKDGGLWYENDSAQNSLIKEKHWWPQAEAMVGFYNAYELTRDDFFLQKSLSSWKFIQTYLLDDKNGEWFWGVREDHSVMPGEDKVGLWKCPYHNTRACLELLKRLPEVR